MAVRKARGEEPVAVRRAHAGEAAVAARLLHESAAEIYDRYASGRERALAMLERAFDTPGTVASADVISLAELGDEPAAAMAAFPVHEAAARSRAFLPLALRAIPPWRWPRMLRIHFAGGASGPHPPPAALYVDALATDPRFRRRGAASALLADAERQARELGLPSVALDTELGNDASRALYARAGFDEVAFRPPRRGLPGFVALVKRLD